MPEDGFLQGLRAICDRHGILLIADEIQSGAGRTGRMWAVEHWGVEPDILLSAKGIASGMPLGGDDRQGRPARGLGSRGARLDLSAAIPVACAAALATLELLEGGLVANAAERGVEQALDGPAPPWQARSPGLVRDVRGKGLMLGIEFDTPEQAEAVQMGGLRARPARPRMRQSSVRMSPALTVSEAEMATALRIFGEAVGEVAAEHGEIREAATAAGAISGVEAGG